MIPHEFVAPLHPGAPCHRSLRALAERFLRCERAGHTLQPTALLHEACLRFRNWPSGEVTPRTVLALYSQAMRWILVDHARRRAARATATAVAVAAADAPPGLPLLSDARLLEIDEALAELAIHAPRQAKVVELRFFGGLSVAETADHLGVTPRTVVRDWAVAKSNMRDLLHDGDLHHAT